MRPRPWHYCPVFILQISGGALIEVAAYAAGFFDTEPQVAASSTGGSGGAGRIFVSDGGSRSIQVVDLGAPTSVTTIHSSSVS